MKKKINLHQFSHTFKKQAITTASSRQSCWLPQEKAWTQATTCLSQPQWCNQQTLPVRTRSMAEATNNKRPKWWFNRWYLRVVRPNNLCLSSLKRLWGSQPLRASRTALMTNQTRSSTNTDASQATSTKKSSTKTKDSHHNKNKVK